MWIQSAALIDGGKVFGPLPSKGPCPWVSIVVLSPPLHVSYLQKFAPEVTLEDLGLPQGVLDFPGDLDGKESDCNSEDLSLIPGLGRSPGEGNDNPFQYSYLGTLMDRGVWWAIVQGVSESDTTD